MYRTNPELFVLNAYQFFEMELSLTEVRIMAFPRLCGLQSCYDLLLHIKTIDNIQL